MHIKLKNKKGQSTVEYVLLVTAVVAVIIAFVGGNNQNGFQHQLNTTLNDVSAEMDTEATQFGSSHTGSPANAVVPAAPYSVDIKPGG